MSKVIRKNRLVHWSSRYDIKPGRIVRGIHSKKRYAITNKDSLCEVLDVSMSSTRIMVKVLMQACKPTSWIGDRRFIREAAIYKVDGKLFEVTTRAEIANAMKYYHIWSKPESKETNEIIDSCLASIWNDITEERKQKFIEVKNGNV